MQTPPVAIGGIGGSGTRVIAGILQDLGYHLGDDLNDSLDNLSFTLLFKRRSLWPPESRRAEIDRLAKVFVNLMTTRQSMGAAEINILRACVDEVTEEHPYAWRQQRSENFLRVIHGNTQREGVSWGWKEPNTHIVLPELRNSIPGLKYVHVMRHGVDMALSVNQNQLKLWGEDLLGRQVAQDNPADSLSYWCASHRRLLGISEEMGENLLMLDFDNFCKDPGEGLQLLAAFLGVELEAVIKDQLCAKIQPPESSGRYKAVSMTLFEKDDLEFVRQLGFVV